MKNNRSVIIVLGYAKYIFGNSKFRDEYTVIWEKEATKEIHFISNPFYLIMWNMVTKDHKPKWKLTWSVKVFLKEMQPSLSASWGMPALKHLIYHQKGGF